MLRTILTVAVTVVGVLFTLNNFDHVPVHLLLGKAVKVRLIFIIFVAGLTGFLIRHFAGVSKEEELKRLLLAERRKRTTQTQIVKRDDELD